MTDNKYQPYGKEWEAHLMKWKKVDLIHLLRTSFKEVEELKTKLKRLDHVSRP